MNVDVDLTRLSRSDDQDGTVYVEPHYLTVDTPEKLNTDLSRKRKLSPVSVQDTPVKKGRSTPLSGKIRKRSEKLFTSNTLITNHFHYFSLVRS